MLQDEELSQGRASTTVIDMDVTARDNHSLQTMQLVDEQVGVGLLVRFRCLVQ